MNTNKNKNVALNGPPPENAAHPERNVPAANLPKGWKKVQLEKNPKVEWYENEESGQEQWFAPGAPESFPVVLEDEEGLNSGWKRAYNSRNNAEPKAIWYEHEDGRTQWDRPATVTNTPKNNGAKSNGPKNNMPTNNGAKLTTTASNGSSIVNLKSKINNLGATLNQMQRTLTKSGGRRKHRNTRRRKTRKSRK
jgi:hypothetical protein